MLISFACPKCTTRLEIDAQAAGGQTQCPKCSAILTAPPKEIGPGVTIGGFRIERLLGKGGMGEVYLAMQVSMNRPVALKILPASVTAQKDVLEAFRREVQTVARLENPNIVAAYEAGEDAGIHFLAMAYVNGESLDTKLAREHVMPERDALAITRKIAAALAYAWKDHRLLHRDIKPANIMLDQRGEPKLTDLGLSQRIGTSDGQAPSEDILGTPNYMSPEHAAGREDLDCRSDMYSLGLTLYHLVTGILPFAAGSFEETWQKRSTESLPDPREVNPNLSAPCLGLLETMLAKDRAERPASWDALVAEMDRVLAKRPWTHAPLPAGHSVIARGKAGPAGKGPRRIVTKSPRTGAGTPAPALPTTERRSSPVAAIVAAATTLAVIAIWLVQSHRSSSSPTVPATPTVQATSRSAPSTPPGPTANRSAPEKLFAAAMEYSQIHSNDFAEAISRFEDVQRKAPFTESWTKAGNEITRLKALRKGTAGTVLAKLKADSDALAAQGKADEAVALLDGYSGAAAEETASARHAMAERLRPGTSFAKAEQERRIAAAKTNLTAVLDGVAAALLMGDAATAQRRLDESQANPALAPLGEEITQIRDLVGKATGMPARVLASFEADKGKDIQVQFVEGPETVQVQAVENGEVLARRHLDAQAYVELRFRPDRLSAAEKAKRLGREAGPEVALMRGLLAIEAGMPPEPEFKQLGGELGDALTRAAEKRRQELHDTAAWTALVGVLKLAGIPAESIAEPDKLLDAVNARTFTPAEADQVNQAAQAWMKRYGQTATAGSMADVLDALTSLRGGTPAVRRKPDAPRKSGKVPSAGNGAAKKAMDDLIALCRVDPTAGDPEATANAILNTTYSDDDKAQIAAALKTFRQRYADAAVAQTMAPVLRALEAASPKSVTARRATAEEIEKAIAELKKYSRDLKATYTIGDDGIEMRLAMSGNALRKLDPLAGLPVVKLDIVGTAIQGDLKVLCGLPLKKLALQVSGNSDLDVISEIPLEQLTITGPLTKITQAARMQTLTSLTLDSASVRELTPLSALPLQTLDLSSCPEVADLAPLAQMSTLKSLYLSRCPKIKTLGQVSALTSLEGLYLSDMDISDLAPLNRLKGLTILHASKCPAIKELWPLAGLPLKGLDIYGCEKIADISKLPDYCPDLESIRLSPQLIRGEWLTRLTALKTVSSTKDNRNMDLPVDQAIAVFDPSGGKGKTATSARGPGKK